MSITDPVRGAKLAAGIQEASLEDLVCDLLSQGQWPPQQSFLLLTDSFSPFEFC